MKEIKVIKTKIWNNGHEVFICILNNGKKENISISSKYYVDCGYGCEHLQLTNKKYSPFCERFKTFLNMDIKEKINRCKNCLDLVTYNKAVELLGLEVQ